MPWSREVGVLVSLCLCACKDTGVLVELSAEPALNEVVTLSVASRFGLLTQTSVDGARLPGAIFVRLADNIGEVRLAAQSGERLAAARQSLTAQQEPRVALKLDGTLPDYDRDGWPDAFDVCPSVANQDQLDTNGDGVGDVCERTFVDAGSDAGSDAGLVVDAGFRPKSCAQQNGAATCVDFETATDVSGYGDAVGELVTEFVVEGAHALRISRDAGLPIYSGRWVTIDDTSRYVRFFLRLGRGAGEVEVLNINDPLGSSGLLLTAKANAGFKVYNPAIHLSFSVTSNLQEEQWYCIEVEARGGADGGLSISQDQVVVSTQSPGTFTWTRYLVEASFDVGQGGMVWLDAIVTSNQPIGCQ